MPHQIRNHMYTECQEDARNINIHEDMEVEDESSDENMRIAQNQGRSQLRMKLVITHQKMQIIRSSDLSNLGQRVHWLNLYISGVYVRERVSHLQKHSKSTMISTVSDVKMITSQSTHKNLPGFYVACTIVINVFVNCSSRSLSLSNKLIHSHSRILIWQCFPKIHHIR